MEYPRTIRKIRSVIRRVNRRLAKYDANPRNADRSLWGELAVVSFANATGLSADVRIDPETVLSDLLADLMHWCDVQKNNACLVESIDFGSALRRAREHYTEECADERKREGRLLRTTIVRT